MTRPPAAEAAILPRGAAVAAFALGAAALASLAPLLAYAGSLALFGLPHVIAELRYVDGRFARRIGSRRGAWILAILGGALAVRSLGLVRWVDPADAYVAELGLVALLAFAVLPDLASSPARAALAVAVGAAIATGSWVAPWATVALLAILHNATPIGFLAERLANSPEFRRGMCACAVLFLVVPLIIATGVASRALADVGLPTIETSIGTVGLLSDHLRVFVPAGWFDPETASRIFAAAAYLQWLHYAAVLVVLPRCLPQRGSPGDSPVVPWPRGRTLSLGIVAIGIVAAVGFTHDFAGTRAAYGLAASFHSWIEIPVLLLALEPAPRSSPRPARMDAAA